MSICEHMRYRDPAADGRAPWFGSNMGLRIG
jgi:hypothetical protein